MMYHKSWIWSKSSARYFRKIICSWFYPNISLCHEKYTASPVELAFGSALTEIHLLFLPDPGVPRVRSMGPSLSNSKTDTFLKLCWCDSGWWWCQLNTSWWCQYHGNTVIPSNTWRSRLTMHNVDEEVTKGVGKVVQELYGVLKQVIMLATV